mgnify:CR=1 FL=1
MSREALPGVFDTIEIISLSIVVGGLLGVGGYFFIKFWYREKKDAEHEEQNGDH